MDRPHEISFNDGLPMREIGENYGAPRYEGDNERVETTSHPLDSAENRILLRKLQQWREEAHTAHALNRIEQQKDADFYDGIQWTESDKADLEARGQAPLVFNVIAQHINWIIGTERRTRVDWTVHPRTDADVQQAAFKKHVMKYVSDANKAPFRRSRAFQDCAKVGVGWLEDGVRDPGAGEEPIFSRTESWRRMWWDPLSRENDLADCRYLTREKWTDLDLAESFWPDRKNALRMAAELNNLSIEPDDEHFYSHYRFGTDSRLETPRAIDSAFLVGQRRERVLLIEMWYRKLEECQVVVCTDEMTSYQSPDLDQDMVSRVLDAEGEEFNMRSRTHQYALTHNLAHVVTQKRTKIYCAIWAGDYLLQNVPSPYRHNRFPFTPIWCFRRERDGMPYSPVRNMRDPQEDLNKRRSKALWILSTRGVIADEDAFEDWSEVEEQMGRPDYILKKKRNRQVEVNQDTAIAKEHVGLMEQDEGYISQAAGVTKDNLGQATNARTGDALEARQDQGSVATTPIFDNYRFSIQWQGEMQMSLIEQYMTKPKMIRIATDRGTDDFVRINQPTVGEDGNPFLLNDIAASRMDFIVSVEDYRDSVRRAMVESLMDLVGNISRIDPQPALALLDLVIDNMDLPGKEEMTKRVRQITGQVDPDDKEAQQRKAQMDQEQAALMKRIEQIEIALREAEGEKTVAEVTKLTEEAKKIREDALKIAAERDKLEAETAATRQGVAQNQDGHAFDMVERAQGLQHKEREMQVKENPPAKPEKSNPPAKAKSQAGTK
jgi:hypothetical protein